MTAGVAVSSAIGPIVRTGAVHRVVERDDVAGGDDVGVVERLGRGEERLGGDVAVGPEDVHPLVGRALLQAHEDHVAGRLDGVRRPTCPAAR